jgi:tRNA (guanine37-N1)-methyltransferase
MWRATIFTLFPEMFPGPLGISLSGEGLARQLWSIEARDIRAHGKGRHRAVDDTPAGGGPGMVIRADVLAASLDAGLDEGDRRPRLLLTPRGALFTHARANTLAAGEGVVVICGRFEGVDERIVAARGLEEMSIGDYVLSGGEIAAFAVLDACVRLLPGVMGAPVSSVEESFAAELLEYPQYTRPREWEGRAIPDVLLSGNHAKINAWREAEALRVTRERRPDLLKRR